jgi:hypothetical protein
MGNKNQTDVSTVLESCIKDKTPKVIEKLMVTLVTTLRA